MTPKLVIFDCDGVLVDSEPATIRIISANLARYGLKVPEDEVETLFVGGTMENAMHDARARGANLPDGWLTEIYSEMFNVLRKGVPVIEGVQAFLDALETAGIATAIASNGPMDKMGITLTPSGLIDRFAGRIYSGHDYTPKPLPGMIEHAMQVAQVSPAETVFIDDSTNGSKAGIAAGVRTFGFNPAGDDGRLAALGAEPVTSMREIAQKIALPWAET